MIQEIIKNELVNLVAGFDYPIIGKANERVELEIKSAAVAKKSFIEYLNNNEKFDESIVAEICKKLVKKTPEELLNEFIEDGHYKEVYGLSFDELGSINDLSEKKYSSLKGFFSRHKDNSVEIKGKKVSLFSLMTLLPLVLEPIPRIGQDFLNLIRNREITCRCWDCGGGGYTFTTVDDYSNPERGRPRKTGSHQEKSLCDECLGKGESTFKVAPYFERYEKNIDKLNETISEILPHISQKISDYNKLIEEFNKKIRIWNSKCPKNAIDSSKKKTEINETIFNFAKKLYEVSGESFSNPSKTLFSVNTILKNNPSDFDVLATKAQSLAWLGRYDEALEVTNEMEKIKSNTILFSTRGLIYVLANNFEEALKQEDKILEINPKDLTALDEKVRILVYSRRYDEALNLMKVILEFYPKKYFDGPLDILSAIVNNKHITSVSSVLFDIKYSQWALAWHELIVTYSKDGHSWDGPFEKYKNNKTTSPAHDTLQPDTNTRRGALPKGY